MDITNIVEAVIVLIFAVISAFFIPYIKNKMDATTFASIVATVKILVHAAEQVFGAGKGEEKKQYVIEKIESFGYKIDTDILDNLIESQVLEMNKEIEG